MYRMNQDYDLLSQYGGQKSQTLILVDIPSKCFPFWVLELSKFVGFIMMATWSKHSQRLKSCVTVVYKKFIQSNDRYYSFTVNLASFWNLYFLIFSVIKNYPTIKSSVSHHITKQLLKQMIDIANNKFCNF